MDHDWRVPSGSDLSPELVEALGRYEHHRGKEMSLARLEAERDLRALLLREPVGVVHGGFRYTFCRHDSWIARIPWPFEPPARDGKHARAPKVRAGVGHGRRAPA